MKSRATSAILLLIAVTAVLFSCEFTTSGDKGANSNGSSSSGNDNSGSSTGADGGTETTKPEKYRFAVGIATDSGDGGSGSIAAGFTSEGTYDKGSPIKVKAVASGDSLFIGWYDSPAKRTPLSTKADYSFSLTKSTTLYAKFSKKVLIVDPLLRQAIRDKLGKITGDLTYHDVSKIATLNYSGLGKKEHIKTLKGIENLTSLQDLRLTFHKINDIGPLANLTKLRTLHMQGNEITVLSPLSKLTNIRELFLYYNKIKDIKPLTNLTKLTSLSLYKNQISNITPLAELVQIRSLFLSHNSITDISPLVKLKSIVSLNLGDNKLTSLSPLASLPNIRYLYLTNTGRSDFSTLPDFPQLIRLDLNRNDIVNISVLAKYTTLSKLNLDYNLIKDLTPLAKLENITELNLYKNKIESIAPLLSNPGIGTGDKINLKGNSLNKPEVDALKLKKVNLQI